MKKTILPIAVVAAAVLLAACGNKEKLPTQPAEDGYTYVLALDGDAKAVFDTDHMAWESGDVIGWFTDKAGSSAINMSTTPKSFAINSTAALSAGSTVYAYAPYKAGDQSKTAAPLSIPVSQSGDIQDAMPMVSLPIVLADAVAAATDTPVGTAKFLNLGVPIRYNVYTTNASYNAEKVESIVFASTGNIAGDFTVDLTAVALNAIPAPTGLDQKTVTTTLGTPATVGAAKASGLKVYQVVAPGTWSGTVTVFTDQAVYNYPVSSLACNRGTIKPVNLDLANATRLSWTEYLLTAHQWELTVLYCEMEGGYEQAAAYAGDKIQFLPDHKLVYTDGGVPGFVYCDVNGWNTGYEFSFTGNESWAIVHENNKDYIQFSNGGFPLIAVDATTIDSKCEIVSVSSSSLQLIEIAQSWGDYSYRLTFEPVSDTPSSRIYSHSFGSGDWGVGSDPTNHPDGDYYLDWGMTNPDVLDGATWGWAITNNDSPAYAATGLFLWVEPWQDFWALQLGNYSNVAVSDFILSSSSFSGTITSVSISYVADSAITVSCTVGGDGFGSPVNLSSGTATFSGSASGTVSIALHATSIMPVWLTGVEVHYTN